MEEKSLTFKKLFYEKKYNELIFAIQTTPEKKQKTTPIQNLLGACITLRSNGKSKEDLLWATKISPKNTSAYETGWNLARQIIEMPKKYVNDKKWSAFGAEMAGKLTGNYGNEVSAKIDREIATQVKNKLESYSVKVKSNAKK